jgi:glycosyltransferase involved in cell wall biosynthesis
VTDVAIVLINNTQVGGAERRFARVWAGLRRRGRAVTLIINRSLFQHLVCAGILSPGDKPIVVMAEPFGDLVRLCCGASRLRFWIAKVDYLLAAVRMTGWLVMNRPKALHLILGGAYLAWPSQALAQAPPTVLSIMCQDLREMVGAGLGERLYRGALKRAAVVDALTVPIREGLIRSGVSAGRIRVSSGSFVDTNRFRPREPKEPWVVFAGRLVEEKNPLLFVEACRLVRQQCGERLPGLRFFLIGDGPFRDEVGRALARHGLTNIVETGWRDDVETVLAGASLFVSLQRTDNYPSQALLEAMACECAVVATDVGQTRRLVDESVGALCRANPEAVASAVGRLLEDPDGARAMGRQGRRRVLECHAIDAYLDYVESVYAEATGGFTGAGVAKFTPSRLTPHA